MANWTKAWNRFVAVLSLQKPELTAGLAHHKETVLTLAERKAGWEYYDQRFSHMLA